MQSKWPIVPIASITPLLLFGLLFSSHGQESKEQVLASISNFHSFIDAEDGFEWKLFEQDGSATVALNPLALTLILTNNHPNGQTKLLELPSVSQVNQVEFLAEEKTLMLRVFQDDREDKEGKQILVVEKVILVQAVMEEGRAPKLSIKTLPKKDPELDS